jgi:predicted RNA methylase
MTNNTTLAPSASVLAKCLRLLASDNDGEIVATVHAMRRVLHSAGLDLHFLATMVEDTARRETLVEITAHNPFYGMRRTSAQNDVVREMLQRCHRRPELLSKKERGFIDSISRWRGPLSPGQMAWLIALYERTRIAEPPR